MKFVSFNINGLRSRLHQLKFLIIKHKPDVLCLQETKVNDNEFPLSSLDKLGYNIFYYGQKMHYGVALFSKIKPIIVQYGFPKDYKNSQRRVIIAKITSPIGIMTIINCYFPQGDNKNNTVKFLNKKKFFLDFKNYLETQININEPILVMGDINVSFTDNDIGINKKNYKIWLDKGKCSFLPEEREWVNNLFNLGLVDIWRLHNPNIKNIFSWFDYRSKGFIKNTGLRIDVILISKLLVQFCIETGIDYDIRSMNKPSDHAPIWAKFIFYHKK